MQKWKLWSTEKRSSRVLYALVGLIIIVFALFWLIGFDRPFDDDPNFNSPLFTDALLIVTALIFLFGVGLAVWSVVRSARTIGKSDRMVNNIPVRRISMTVLVSTVVVMLLSFVLGSSKPMVINGQSYTDGFWLHVSDMFIVTSMLLIVAAIAAVVYGATKYNRKS